MLSLTWISGSIARNQARKRCRPRDPQARCCGPVNKYICRHRLHRQRCSSLASLCAGNWQAMNTSEDASGACTCTCSPGPSSAPASAPAPQASSSGHTPYSLQPPAPPFHPQRFEQPAAGSREPARVQAPLASVFAARFLLENLALRLLAKRYMQIPAPCSSSTLSLEPYTDLSLLPCIHAASAQALCPCSCSHKH